MENKKLNLNRPPLSVRKYTITVAPQKDDEMKFHNAALFRPRFPHYNSELKSGPVRNPGAVPFQWEQIPGQPKDDIRPIIPNCDRPPFSPKLPPCRYSSTSDNNDQSVNIPRGPHTGPPSKENKSLNSRDRGEAYVDAIDTLSRTQSFFLNCSDLDGLNANPSGLCSREPHIREFMIDRFLPERKAMAAEMPQNAPEKTCGEKCREIKNIVPRDRPLLRYGPSFTKRFAYCDTEEEEEESDDDCDEHGNFNAVCGLLPLPRFCLNVMNVSTREAMSPANNIQPALPSHSNCEIDTEQSKFGISEETKRSGITSVGHSSHGKGFKTFQELLLTDEDSPEELDSSEGKNVINTKSVDQTRVIDSSIEDSSDKWNLKRGLEMSEAFAENRDFYQDCTTIGNTEEDKKDACKNLEKELRRGKIPEYSNKTYSEFIVPPPLPKSPSDSWLGRTLPTMYSKNVSQRSYPNKLCSKAITSDIKWEAIVKSTKVQRPNLRYSEELLTPIPEM